MELSAENRERLDEVLRLGPPEPKPQPAPASRCIDMPLPSPLDRFLGEWRKGLSPHLREMILGRR